MATRDIGHRMSGASQDHGAGLLIRTVAGREMHSSVIVMLVPLSTGACRKRQRLTCACRCRATRLPCQPQRPVAI